MFFRSLVSLVACMLFLPLGQASAATVIEPQILAMIATNGAKPLVCKGDTCAAEFSAFCMEPGRPGPSHGSAYNLSKSGGVKLIARTADGKEWQIPATAAQFASQRGYSAVRITVSRQFLRKIGADSLAVAIGKKVTLLPERIKDYVRPHKKNEIAAALGPNRIIDERIVDNGGKRADGARFLSYLLNALPLSGKVSQETRQSLWQATKLAPAKTLAGGKSVARKVYNDCRSGRSASTNSTLRECLQHHHDRNMWLLNQISWQSVGPQS